MVMQITRIVVVEQCLSSILPFVQVDGSMLSAFKLGPSMMSASRVNGFLNMLETIKKQALILTEQLPQFPSLLISANAIVPQVCMAKLRSSEQHSRKLTTSACILQCGVRIP